MNNELIRDKMVKGMGGFANPATTASQTAPGGTHVESVEHDTGNLTLLDHYAAASLSGMLANGDVYDRYTAAHYDEVFRHACEMLKARQRFIDSIK